MYKIKMNAFILKILMLGYFASKSEATVPDLDVSNKGNQKHPRDVDTVEYFRHELDQMVPEAPEHTSSFLGAGDGNVLDVGFISSSAEHFWSIWSEWSSCSRTCGTGVTSRSRECITSHIKRNINENCAGEHAEHKLCNMQECPEWSKDFRASQCAEQNKRSYHSGIIKWTPYLGLESGSCELTCIASKFNFFHSFGSAIDGTECGIGGKDICIQGKCTKIGCDNVIESGIVEDRCGVCGGNNESCFHYQNVYDSFPEGGADVYKKVARIPIGATHIKVKDYTRNFLALKEIDGDIERYIVNGNWVIGWPGQFKTAGTTMVYKREKVKETFEIVGPTAKELDVMVLSLGQRPLLEYEYWAPNSLRTTSDNGYGELEVQKKVDIDIIDEESYKNQIILSGLDFNAVRPPTAEPTTITTITSMPSTTMVTTDVAENSKPGVRKPTHCRDCKRSLNRKKTFCESDFVVLARVTPHRIQRGIFTRYEVIILKAYRKNFKIMRREYVWTSKTCCHKLRSYRNYLIMGRKVKIDIATGKETDNIDMNPERSPRYETRLVVDHSSYWYSIRKYHTKMTRLAKHINCKRHRYGMEGKRIDP